MRRASQKPKISSQRRGPGESPRDAAMRILKIRGAVTIVELMRSLKLTETAVRRHLNRLKLDGLVTVVSQTEGHGRPAHVYRLSDKASTDYFPTGYEELAERMLDTIFDTDNHRAVFDFLVAANQHTIQQLFPNVLEKSLKDRVQFLVQRFAKHGYMSDSRELPDGKFFLYHRNCAIYNAAMKYRQLCFVELKLIEAITAAKVTRTQYIFKNQPICGYLISPLRI